MRVCVCVCVCACVRACVRAYVSHELSRRRLKQRREMTEAGSAPSHQPPRRNTDVGELASPARDAEKLPGSQGGHAEGSLRSSKSVPHVGGVAPSKQKQQHALSSTPSPSITSSSGGHKTQHDAPVEACASGAGAAGGSDSAGKWRGRVNPSMKKSE